MQIYFFFLLTFNILASVLVSMLAGKWGRKALKYFCLSLLFSPLFGVLVLLIKGKDVSSINYQKIRSRELKHCSYCGELINYSATTCKFCGKSLQSYTVNQTPSSCNTAPQSEGSEFYTFETLDEEKKSVTNEYIDKVLNCIDLGEVLKIQRPYFGTTGLEYLEALLPDAYDFKDILIYKTKMQEAKAKLNSETIDIKPLVNVIVENSTNENTLEEQLTELKVLLDKGLIDETDYKTKKKIILGIE